MSALLALLLAADLPVRTVRLSRAAIDKPVRIACPIVKVTRIRFPERFLPGGVRASRGATDALGIALEASQPVGVITVEPSSHPAEGTVVLQGPNVSLTLQLRTVQDGLASEVRFVIEDAGTAPANSPAPVATSKPKPPEPRATETPGKASSSPRANPSQTPSSTPSPAVSPAASASPSPQTAPTPSHPSPPSTVADAHLPDSGRIPPLSPVPLPTPTPGDGAGGGLSTGTEAFDFEALLLAKPEQIGTREGLPGQPAVILEDALKSDKWIWLRFRVPGGRKTEVRTISWEHGPVHSFRAQVSKGDLRLVVQLPRNLVNKKTRVTLQLVPGGTYRFALSAPWLSTFVKGLLGS